MRRLLLLCILSVLVTLRGFSQNAYVDSLEHWLQIHPTVDSEYIQTLHRLSYRLNEKDVKRSFAYYERVSFLSDSLHFLYGKSLAQINLGILLANSGNYQASNNAYFKAITEAEACGSLRLQAVSMNNIGDNFKTLRDYDKSRQYARQGIAINTRLKAARGVAINYELLFQCDFEESLIKQAERDLNTGKPYAIRADDSYIWSQYYLGYGKIKAIAQEYDSARFFFNLALKEAGQQTDIRNTFNVYIAQSEFLHETQPQRRLEYLMRALSIARDTRYLQGISTAAQQLSSLYDQLENKDSSYFFYHIYRAAADTMFSENNTRNVIIKESEWMIRKKEIENQNLVALSGLQRKELAFKNGLLLAVVISLLLSLAIGFFISKSIRSKKEKEKSIFNQRIAETQMQALRSQMNPHFIFNSLNSIENFMMKNEKRTASDYLGKFAMLIRLILDSSNIEQVPLSKDLQALQLYVELEQLRFDYSFEFKTCLDEELTHQDISVPGLLIQPYLENAILHGLSHSKAEGLCLQLRVQLKDDYVTYTIEDNGIGRKRSEEYNRQNERRHKSRGMSITQERINILNHQVNANGKIEITDLYHADNKPAGTKVAVTFKALRDANT